MKRNRNAFIDFLEVSKSRVIIISDGANWVIDNVSLNMNRSLKQKGIASVAVKNSRLLGIFPFLKKRVFYFVDRWAYLDSRKDNYFRKLSRHNRIIVIWWHSSLGEKNAELIKSIKTLKLLLPYFRIIHVSCGQEYNSLIEKGIPPSKLKVIPEGVEDFFKKATAEEKALIRRKLGIPPGAFCIGYFQKDGIGWKEGNQPKLDKGPDIFIEVAGRLFRKYKNTFILLTGPSRGYVKAGLQERGIPFVHNYLTNYAEIADYYKALDLYLITSRTEGGPKSVLESFASGIPVVSTRVGMCNDIIKDNYNGFLCEVEDVEGVYKRGEELILNSGLREHFARNGLVTVKDYSWDKISAMIIQQCINE